MGTGHKKSASIMIGQNFEIRRVPEDKVGNSLKYLLIQNTYLFLKTPFRYLKNSKQILELDEVGCRIKFCRVAICSKDLVMIFAAYLLNPQTAQISPKI